MTKNPLVVDPFAEIESTESDNKKEELVIDEQTLQEVEHKVEQDIPSNYITINLPSNGRVEGIPSILHFRDYTGNDAVDLNVYDDDESLQAIVNVLKRMCYENFDIGILPIPDVLYILYTLHFTFISPEIEKTIYLNEDLPEGDKEGELDYEENIETVTIPFSAIRATYLGKDENDKDLDEKVKFPITLTDTKTNDKVKLKLASLKDTLIARNYCKAFFREKFIEFADVRKKLSDIQNIKKKDVREAKLNEYLIQNEDEVNSYYAFMKEYALTVAKFIQAMQIIAFNGEEITDKEQKWDLYQNKISSDMWQFYNIVTEKYQFGLNESINVYSSILQKNVKRRVSFQFFDFLSFNRKKEDDRFNLSFD